MTAIVFPSSLPVPSANTMVPLERRLLSTLTEGKPGARTVTRDFVGFETLQWDLTIDESAIWDDFWKNTLVKGGRWFASAWLRFSGEATVIARFTTPPAWKYIGNDRWQISVGTEIRGTLNKTAPPFVEPGGARPYDVLWDLLAVRLDNSSYEQLGESFTSEGVSWGPVNERNSVIRFSLFTHNLATFIPAGPSVVFTATTVRTDGSGYGSVPAVETQSSTTLRRMDITIDLSPYGRYYAPMRTDLTVTVGGVAAPFTASFSTAPRAGYGTPGSLYTLIDLSATSAYT